MARVRRLALLALAVVWLGGLFSSETLGQSPSTVRVEPSANPPAAPDAAETSSAKSKSTSTSPKKKGAEVDHKSMLGFFSRSNPMVWLLGLCSIVTLGFTLERMVALRRERVIPREFVSRFLERLAGGKLDRDRATELCRANDSAVARIFAMVINAWGQPAATIRQTLDYDAAGEISDLKRNVRVLNGTATLAPLLGLLGTVVGMIQSFNALGGRVGPAKGEALAQGISLALVATAVGLAIAIVSVAAYYYLLNRVDVLVRDLDENARKVIDLVSAESLRPMTDRRSPLTSAGDMARHESRLH